MTAREWTLLIYRVPTEPASKRVGLWRDLKRLGALYLQQCVCIFPRLDSLRDEVERIIAKIPALGGECMRFDIPRLPPDDEARIVASFRTLRNKEYAEIVEECETKFVKEIEFEQFRQNYTFEEAEEIGQDLEKIRRWFARVTERDWFAADGRQAVEEWIIRCQELLDTFEQEVYRRRGTDADGPDGATLAGGELSPLPIPSGNGEKGGDV
jgi:hypothetical protein